MIDQRKGARVALAHDWLVGMRGGEQVLDRLARRYGPTTLYTLVAGGAPLTEAIDRCEIVTSPLQRLPGAAGRLRRWYLPLMPWAVERLVVDRCDLLISTSSAVIKSIRCPPGTPHLCYCHGPARYVWEQGSDYRGGLRGAGLRLAGRRLRRWDLASAGRVTTFLANSRHTAGRIERCFGRRAAVVHPPVRTGYFTPDPGVAREDWFLAAGALEPYKRFDLVIESANRARLPLVIVGDGSQRRRLEALAGPTVTFAGRVDDAALRDLYRRAAALVFPQLEDFGIIAAEALATGCPVVAYAAGGALDIVTEETGVLFAAQSPEAVIDAARTVRRDPPDPRRCRAQAERFGEDRFDAEIDEWVGRVMGESDEATERRSD